MLVTRTGVAEVRYLNDQGQVEGQAQDLYDVQNNLPKSHDAQKLFCMKNMQTGLQASFFCCVCEVPVLSLINMAIHCGAKLHLKRVQEQDSGGVGESTNHMGNDV